MRVFQTKTIYYKYMKRFRVTGSVLDKTRRRHILTGENLDVIRARLEASPRKSVVQLAQQTACLHHQREMQQNCCTCIQTRQRLLTHSLKLNVKQN
jgi:ribosomal protein L35